MPSLIAVEFSSRPTESIVSVAPLAMFAAVVPPTPRTTVKLLPETLITTITSLVALVDSVMPARNLEPSATAIVVAAANAAAVAVELVASMRISSQPVL